MEDQRKEQNIEATENRKDKVGVGTPECEAKANRMTQLSNILVSMMIALPFAWHHPALLSDSWLKKTVEGWNGFHPWHAILLVIIVAALTTSVWAIVKNVQNKGKWHAYIRPAFNVIFVMFFILLLVPCYLVGEDLLEDYSDFWNDFSPIAVGAALLWWLGGIDKNLYLFFSKGNNLVCTKAKCWLIALLTIFIVMWMLYSFTSAMFVSLVYVVINLAWNDAHETCNHTSGKENKPASTETMSN